MTISLIAMIAVLGADPFLQPVASPNVTPTRSVYSLTPITTAFYDGEPATQNYDGPAQTFSTPSPSQQTYVAPQGQPYVTDPSLGQQPPPYGFPQPYSPGLVGPQPYRLGWSSRYDVAWMPNAAASNGRGDMEIFEANAALRNSTGWPPGLPNWIMSFTPEFNLRTWQGPGLVDLPPQVYRFAGDIELAAPGRGPWGFHAGFTPAIVSDFEGPLTSKGFNFDGRGYLTFQATPQLMLVGGAMYWDRVVDRILPYGGFVWTPNDLWEWRILFPKSRVSVFLGNTWGAATWLYGAFEYNAEAYQIVIDNRSAQDKIEVRDLRATVGLRFDNGSVQSFIEGARSSNTSSPPLNPGKPPPSKAGSARGATRRDSHSSNSTTAPASAACNASWTLPRRATTRSRTSPRAPPPWWRAGSSPHPHRVRSGSCTPQKWN